MLTLKQLFFCLTLIGAWLPTAASSAPLLFGSPELEQTGLDDLPQVIDLLARHRRSDLLDLKTRDDQTTILPVAQWHTFLHTLENLSPAAQIVAVHKFINEKKYILDITNYGQDDYWAIVKELLQNNGDCEDFALAKYFSLRLLGFPAESLRIAIVQDTNLGIAHAVLAVYREEGIVILDNQSQEVVPQRQLIHYLPLYSVNENHWWFHLPPLPGWQPATTRTPSHHE